MTDRRRVVVTGMGAVTPFGLGLQSFRDGLRAGSVVTGPVTVVDVADFPRVNGGQVDGLDVDRHADATNGGGHRVLGRAAVMAVQAARLAMRDSGLDGTCTDTAGAVFGTTNGMSDAIESLAAAWVHEGLSTLSADIAKSVPAGCIASAVAADLGLPGEVQTFATACSASNYAVGYGGDLIASGEADVMVVGGADAFNRWGHAGFYRLGALAESTCRPFDADRDGMLTSEGAACLILESHEHATARGARIYAELIGYGTSCDAAHPTAPDAASIARCITTALANAEVDAADVDYICAHGTGTPTNDVTEVAAIRMAYGDNAIPPISSIKSMIGHTMGAASGLGAVACCLSIHEQFLPPTAGLETVDPALGDDLDPIPAMARPARVRVVQNNGFAFGGNNAITIFAECAA